MKNTKAFTLINGGKMPFFNCHWRLLSIDHKYRKTIKEFFVGRFEMDVALSVPSNEELCDVVS
jgi:hypothetical protein